MTHDERMRADGAMNALDIAGRRIKELEVQIATLRETLRYLVEMSEPPEPNCSCHICPPCADCVENSGVRDAIKSARSALAATAPKQKEASE